MIVSYNDEHWKYYKLEGSAAGEYFKVSNYGRVVRRFDEGEDEKPYSATSVNGYDVINVKSSGKRHFTKYLHKVVAQLFVENPENKEFVIHLDYNKLNNKANNLKWATQSELTKHHFNNLEVILSKEKRKINQPYTKLTEGKVRLIKRKIFDPNRRTRLKMIAKQFGISEMQLWRIKSGENWGHITDY